MGAVLSIGGQTVASHITSAYLQECLPRASAAIDVTTDRSPGERRGIVVHRNKLEANDIVNVRGIPCASIYRTLVDLCSSQPESTCESALDAALRMERVNFDRLCAYADEAASRRIKGSSLLRRLLEVRGAEDALSESEAESLFSRIMRRADLPIGERQTTREGIRNGRIDFFYPDQKLVIEIDGRKFHSGRRERMRDRRYDNELNIGGNRVLRLTWIDLTTDAAYTIDLVARALGIERLF
jgi:very-short-patch-repair endonuclease